MDLNEYHRAWNLGFSESECVRMAEDKWEDNQLENAAMEKHYRKQEETYFQELERQIEADIDANDQSDRMAGGEASWSE